MSFQSTEINTLKLSQNGALPWSDAGEKARVGVRRHNHMTSYPLRIPLISKQANTMPIIWKHNRDRENALGLGPESVCYQPRFPTQEEERREKKQQKKTSNGSSRTVWFTLLSRSESAESERNSYNEWSELSKENMVAASLPFSRHVILTTKEPTTRRITSWSVTPTFQQAGAPQQRPLQRICLASLGERPHFKVFRETKFIYGLNISDQRECNKKKKLRQEVSFFL